MIRVSFDLLNASHKKPFECGNEPLNNYFTRQASQDMRRKVSFCYVAVDPAGDIAGYYTLSAAEIVLDNIPETVRKRLPNYRTVPAARLGRLAVSVQYQGQGLGGVLLGDAWNRILNSGIAAWAMIVDAKDESIAKFYEKHGFTRFEPNLLQLFMPTKDAAASR